MKVVKNRKAYKALIILRKTLLSFTKKELIFILTSKTRTPKDMENEHTESLREQVSNIVHLKVDKDAIFA